MSSRQIPVDEHTRAPGQVANGVHEIAPDLAYQRHLIVNVVYWGFPGADDRQWVLIDAGITGSAGAIVTAAQNRFGELSRPAAIVLTHGHFDHVGAVAELADRWEAPVYAHSLECPYLNGTASYPPPDPSVGGGLMSTLSRFYPRGPIDVSAHLEVLPESRNIPGMPGWQWIHVPGHTPGQIALWRDHDRTLIAADAFITTQQESAYAVLTQEPQLHGPPMYYTQDWEQSRESVRRLAAQEPELVVAGHGPALRGAAMRAALHTLARDFDELAMPDRGRYVDEPASIEAGTAYSSSH